MKVLALLTVVTIILGLEQSAGQSGLLPFAEWSKADAEKILNDSPWARSQTVKIRQPSKARRVAGAPIDMSSGSPTQTSTDLGGAEAPVDFTFTLRLRSARRIREALVRLKQIEAGYDSMTAAKQAEFDAQPRNRGLLACPACEQNYIVTLSSKSKEAPGSDAVFSVFKGGRLADLQRYIFIANNRGERRALIHFVPPKAPGEEAVFYFERLNERGLPLLTADDTELIANFTNNDVNINTNFKIEIRSLITNGQIDF